MSDPVGAGESLPLIPEPERRGERGRGRGASFRAWITERATVMSFAMFFMLVCGGFVTAAYGPALPIIEEQLNMFVCVCALLRLV